MNQTLLYSVSTVLLCCLLCYSLYKAFVRLRLSRAKHPSLRGHSKWSRRIAALIPYFEYSESAYFSTDGAPDDIIRIRKAGLERLTQQTEQANAASLNQSKQLESSISDVEFTSHYRVPFPYRKQLDKAFQLGSIVEETQGAKVKDIDGNWRFDLSGSYGVNVFGYEFYKQCINQGFEKVKALGPVLGSYHPLIQENVNLIKRVSQLDEVSFHMSGTEAVMQAVRLARYHTEKTHLVRFCGAYHGWWDGVQPGVGNRRKVNDVYTLEDMSKTSLRVLETRSDIACVLINPLQAFHPNSDSSSDTTLIASDRTTSFNKQAYSEWLHAIREICTERNIVLIFDEVFTGFRLSYRGAQGFFGVQADLVTYGKTLGGGLPVGVLCGKAELMKRFKHDKPVSVSFARGTFNSHPYVLGAMNVFLKYIHSDEVLTIYEKSEALWNKRTARFNDVLRANNLPLSISNMHSILTVLYSVPSRYNWLFQFYLRNTGIELSWTGTGRLIMSFNFSDDEFEELIVCFVTAAKQMQADGWWWQSPLLTNKAIKRQFLCDMLSAKFPRLKAWIKGPLNSSNTIPPNVITPIHEKQV